MHERTHERDGPSRRDVLRRSALTSAALATGASALSASATAQSTCDVTVDDSGGADFTTIQAAIDDAETAPGATVCVEPGSYSGTVTVDKQDLTLRATADGATITDGDNAGTSTADNTDPVVSIEADGVTVSGFEVSYPDGLLGIKVQSGYDGVTVENNTVSDVGPVGVLGTTGIIGGGPHDDLTIRDNLVEDLTNEINEESGFPTVNGIFVDDEGSGSLTNSTIVDNEVRDLESDVAAIGIILGIDAENVTVERNHVHDLRADPAVDSDDSDDPYVYEQTFAQGLNVSGGTTNVTFRENVVSDVTATYFVGTGLKIDGEADGLTVEFNDLLPTVGIENADSDTVTATCNYWGHPRGPREVSDNRDADDGPNRQGRSAVVGPAEFEPWLVRSVENGQNLENSCVGGRGRGNGRGNN